eukprot:m51a1_g642 putative protein kinase domain containing protein (828) ;mRNA; r:173481-176289
MDEESWGAWLESVSVDAKYAAVLAAAELAPASLALLTDADWDSLGVRLGPRRALRRAATSVPAALDGVVLREELGRGSFGAVYRGTWHRAAVAVKKLFPRGGGGGGAGRAAPHEEDAQLAAEAALGASLRHPNVAAVFGVFRSAAGALHVVTEYAPGGSLLSYLRSRRTPLPASEALRMAGDVASGMQYLAARGVVHRDLSARNVLCFGPASAAEEAGFSHEDSPPSILKICDFGLSGKLQDGILLRKTGVVPKRWTAPEALRDGIYTTSSDVWSFGVLMWELFETDQRPYSDIEDADDLLPHLLQGKRLPKAKACPQKVYDLMARCWDMDPARRPTFAQLSDELDAMMRQPKQSRSCPSPSDYDIASAIDACSAGAVYVPPGLHVVRRTIVLAKSIRLSSEGDGLPQLRTSGDFAMFRVTAGAELSVESMMFRSTEADAASAASSSSSPSPSPSSAPVFVVESGALSVLECEVRGGVTLLNGSSLHVARSNVCSAPGGSGLSLEQSSSARVENCKIVECKTGLSLSGASSCSICESLVADCETCVQVADSATLEMRESTVCRAQTGVRVSGSSTTASLAECEIHECARRGVMLSDGAETVLSKCHLWGHAKVALESDGASPVVSDCTVRTNRAGLFLKNGNGGSFKDVDIWGSALTGIELKSGTEAVFQDCSVHECEESGVYAHSGGGATFRSCRVFGNCLASVEVAGAGTEVEFDTCNLNDSGTVCVWAKEEATGSFKLCDVFGCSPCVRAASESRLLFDTCHLHGSDGAPTLTCEGRALVTLHACRLFDYNCAEATEAETGSTVELSECVLERSQQSSTPSNRH